jgi:hypothetical protein
MPQKPNMTQYGDSGSKYHGSRPTDGVADRDISIGVGESTLTDTITFSPFEETIRAYMLGSLGYPTVKVELTDFNIKQSIDEAVTFMTYHAPLWTNQFLVFDASAGCNMYELPQHVLNNLEYVVYKKSLLSIQAQSNTLEFDFFIKYFQDNFLFSDFSVGEFYMLQSHMEQIRKILSQEGTWDVIDNKYLQLQPFPATTPDPVIVIYRAISSDTIHPMYRNWIQRYATAKAMTILGRVRGKYSSLPGPGGGAVLDGKELREEGKTEMDELRQELLTELEEPVPFTTF